MTGIILVRFIRKECVRIYILALKATSDPILMSESATVTKQVTVTAFDGTDSLILTLPIHSLNGKPSSLAKAHVCRDVERLKLRVPAKMRMVGITFRATTPPSETAFLKTQMCGYPVAWTSCGSTKILQIDRSYLRLPGRPKHQSS